MSFRSKLQTTDRQLLTSPLPSSSPSPQPDPARQVRLLTFGLNAGNQCAQGRACPQQPVPALCKLTLAKGVKLGLVEAGAGHTTIVV